MWKRCKRIYVYSFTASFYNRRFCPFRSFANAFVQFNQIASIPFMAANRCIPQVDHCSIFCHRRNVSERNNIFLRPFYAANAILSMSLPIVVNRIYCALFCHSKNEIIFEKEHSYCLKKKKAFFSFKFTQYNLIASGNMNWNFNQWNLLFEEIKICFINVSMWLQRRSDTSFAF